MIQSILNMIIASGKALSALSASNVLVQFLILRTVAVPVFINFLIPVFFKKSYNKSY